MPNPSSSKEVKWHVPPDDDEMTGTGYVQVVLHSRLLFERKIISEEKANFYMETIKSDR